MSTNRVVRTTTTTIYSVIAFLVCFLVTSYVGAYAPIAIDLVRIAFTGDFLGYAVTGLEEDHQLVTVALNIHSAWFDAVSLAMSLVWSR